MNNPTKSKNFVVLCRFSKLNVYLIVTFVTAIILVQIHFLQIPLISTISSASSYAPSWSSVQAWREVVFNSNCTARLDAMIARLRDSVTFLPLKDLRFAKTAMQDHTWFMSSLNDTYDGDKETEYQYFPSQASKGRLLCLMGRDRSDGGKNAYALAWPDSLPAGAALLEGLTYVSDTYYDYGNLWHGLSATMPFVGWYKNKGRCVRPNRWILYHRGELRLKMGAWVGSLMEASFGIRPNIEDLDGSRPTCLEKAIVLRHNMGRMVREKRAEVFDMMRCKARAFCNVSRGGEVGKGVGVVGLTLLLRSGARSFKNDSDVIGIFERECGKVEGCRLSVARSDNLTFCQQVKLMSSTDILASSHGAQLTNMFFMERNSSVMEFFPRGWLELAGVGQYVFHWEASWADMRHEGAWRDTHGDECPKNPPPPNGCMSFYKSSKIGLNETHLTEWIRNVINQVKIRRLEEDSKEPVSPQACPCN